jgi:hypothetical protein
MAQRLHFLREDPDDLSLLVKLQRDILRAVLRAERDSDRYRRVRAGLKRSLASRLSKDKARQAKDHLGACDLRLTDLKALIVFWKTIGDGIAHIFLDKYALKQTFYKADSYQAKETAGFISGNAGHAGEWALLEEATEAGVGALLCDLTNVIRHGDVCLLGGPGGTPYLMEVKSSDNQNRRTSSQAHGRQLVQDFLSTDVARNFKGAPVVGRVAIAEEEVNHFDSINACISSALTQGVAVVMPEAGLYYVAISDIELSDEAFASIPERNDLHAFSLTEAKRRGAWDFFQPFVLSFAPELSGAFLRGEVVVFVLVDMAVVRALFEAEGARCTVRMDGTTSLYIEKIKGEGAGSFWLLSEAIFFRVPFEFQSLAWFVRTQATLMFFPEDLSTTWTAEAPQDCLPPFPEVPDER